MTDPYVGQLTFFRVYSGTIKTGDTIFNPIKGRKERLGRILQMHANQREEIKEVFAEKQYKYYSYDDLRYKISDDKTQLKIVAKRKLSELRYFELWVVENFDWSAHPYGLVRNYNSGYPPDSLLVNLILVDINDSTGRAGINDKKVIGSFMLRRK
jgi:hypothetical protein